LQPQNITENAGDKQNVKQMGRTSRPTNGIANRTQRQINWENINIILETTYNLEH